MKPVVALDLDDLIFPFVDNLIGYFNERNGKTLTIDDYNTFDFEHVWGTSRRETVDIVHEFFGRLEEHPEPLEGAVEAVRKLENDFELVIATARADELREFTLAWMQVHFPDVFSQIHLCNLYIEGRDTRRSKADVCNEIGAIALVDDSLHNVTQVAALGLRGILYGNFPWNEATTLPANVTRAADWGQVLDQLGELR